MNINKQAQQCPCGSQQTYSDCCAPLHRGELCPQSAESLMRSRYSAYALQSYQYLIDSHHPNSRAGISVTQLAESNCDTHWLALKIIQTSKTRVSFRAYYRIHKQISCLHEDSRFQVFEGRWHYLDDTFDESQAVLPGRKQVCFCSSGKKYKHCHGA
jgi:SEC-C motif-containing protein